MAYRNHYIEADLRENDLRKLADLGRLRADRLRREREKRAEIARRKEAAKAAKAETAAVRARQEQLQRLMSRWAAYRTPVPLVYTAASAVGLVLLREEIPLLRWMLWFFAVVPVALFLFARWMTKRGHLRERHWVEGLGFPATGYWESLPVPHRNREIRFYFDGRAPSQELVSDLLCGQGVDGWTVEAQPGGNDMVLKRRDYLSLRSGREAFRAALSVGRLLAEVYPIREAQVTCA